MKKTKLILIAVSTFLVSSTSFAHLYKDYQGVVATPGLMDGFYVGARAGYDMYTVRDNLGLTDPDGDVFTMNPKLSPNGWAGGFFLGFGKYLGSWFYLGGEASFNASGAATDYSLTAVTDSETGGQDIDSITTKVNANNNYGLALIPGFKVNNNALVYARLGYTWSQIRAREIFATEGPTATFSTTRTVGGMTYGLGSEILLVGNFSLRGDYTYTSFNTLKAKTTNTRFNPTDNQVMVGVSYHI